MYTYYTYKYLYTFIYKYTEGHILISKHIYSRIKIDTLYQASNFPFDTFRKRPSSIIMPKYTKIQACIQNMNSPIQ